jgi:hypothetical protein
MRKQEGAFCHHWLEIALRGGFGKSPSKCTPVEIFNNETSSSAERLSFILGRARFFPFKM